MASSHEVLVRFDRLGPVGNDVKKLTRPEDGLVAESINLDGDGGALEDDDMVRVARTVSILASSVARSLHGRDVRVRITTPAGTAWAQGYVFLDDPATGRRYGHGLVTVRHEGSGRRRLLTPTNTTTTGK